MVPLGSAKGFLYGLTFELPAEMTSLSLSSVPQGWVLPSSWLGFTPAGPGFGQLSQKGDFPLLAGARLTTLALAGVVGKERGRAGAQAKLRGF